MAAEPAVELKGKINPAQIFHKHSSEATHENILKQYEEQLKAHQEAAEVAFDKWSTAAVQLRQHPQQAERAGTGRRESALAAQVQLRLD